MVETEYSTAQAMDPAFRLADVTINGRDAKQLYMQTFYPNGDVWNSHAPENWHHIANILSDQIAIWPVFTVPYTQRYLRPRHGRIQALILAHGELESLPETAEDALRRIALVAPFRVFNDSQYGFGLIKELDGLFSGLLQIPGLTTIVIKEIDRPQIDGSFLFVSSTDLESIYQEFERIKRSGRERIKLARNWLVRNDFLPLVDPIRFPKVEQVSSGNSLTLVEFRRAQTRKPAINQRQERRSTVDRVKADLPQLVAEEPRQLLELRLEIEKVTLARMIELFEQMISQKLTETKWQRFFEENIFILNILFTRPVKLLHPQFHARGSGISGNGAQVGDFLFTEHGQALAIIEIKKPNSDLLSKGPYRNTEVYGPSADLAGAVNQVLYQQNSMRENWLMHHSREIGLRDSGSEAINCIVISGTYPTEPVLQRNFEIYRSSLKDVEVITYDELHAKLLMLQRYLSDQSENHNKDVF